MKQWIEVCAGSYSDVVAAYRGGADRVELNCALHLGGLTPSVGSLVLAKRHTGMKIITMVRPRGAGFYYDEEEFEVILADVKSMLDNGADGIAFGCLDAQGNIDIDKNKQIIAMIKEAQKEAVFHRAFDCAADPYKAMETLIALGVDRVLTSGLEAKAMQGKELLKDLQSRYGGQIEILAGSGINAGNAKALMEYTGIHQVHSSCKDWRNDPTTSMNHVTYAYADGEHTHAYDVVSEELVKNLVASIQEVEK